MRKFFIFFSILLVIEIAISLLHLSFHNTVLSFLNFLISLPLSQIDRSYPFYAEDNILGLFLTLISLTIHTLIVIMIFKVITNYRKSNSL